MSEKIKENRSFIYKNIISENEISDYCVKRYNEDNKTDLNDYDFYHLDNCKDLEKNYYIELLESILLNYYKSADDFLDTINQLQDEKFILSRRCGEYEDE